MVLPDDGFVAAATYGPAMALAQTSPPSDALRKGRPVPREELFTIGDVAREFGVTLRTLRFYEDKGLVAPYRDNNSRLYRESDRAKIALILQGKALGFTLGEIRESIATVSGAQSRATLKLRPEQIVAQIAHLNRQRADIEDAITQLQAAHAKLIA